MQLLLLFWKSKHTFLADRKLGKRSLLEFDLHAVVSLIVPRGRSLTERLSQGSLRNGNKVSLPRDSSPAAQNDRWFRLVRLILPRGKSLTERLPRR